MSDKPEVRITPKQQRAYQFICEFYSANGRVPKLREVSEHTGAKSDATITSFINSLVSKGLLCRFTDRRGYGLPDERPEYSVRDAYHTRSESQETTRQQTAENDSQPGSIKPADEFQYIRLAPGEAATIGELYIGVVDIEDDKRVAALEVIAPASLGVLRRDVRSDLDQTQQPGPNEILLRCMEKTIELLATEIYRLRKAGTQPAGRRGA